MVDVNMSDPDGVRKHGDGFHNASERVGKINETFKNLRMNSSTLGEEWAEHGSKIAEALASKVPTPWQRAEKFHKAFGDAMHFAANTYQDVEETHEEKIKNTHIPDGKL